MKCFWSNNGFASPQKNDADKIYNASAESVIILIPNGGGRCKP